MMYFTNISLGYLPNHSTTFQLIDIYHHICETFHSNQYSCMIYLDVTKAFDRVWHRGLVFKLNKTGIGSELLERISEWQEAKMSSLEIPHQA